MKKYPLVILSMFFITIAFFNISSTIDRKKISETEDLSIRKEYILMDETNIESSPFEIVIGKKTDSQPGLIKVGYYLGKVGESGKIVFFDEDLNIIDEHSIDQCRFSDDGSFVLAGIQVSTSTENRSSVRKYVLYDDMGKSYWARNDTVCDDCKKNRYYVANDGTAIEMTFHSQTPLMSFLSVDGLKTGEVELFREGFWEPGAPKGFTGNFSSDSRYFVLNAYDLETNTFNSGSAIILFTKSGRELWRYNVDFTHAFSAYISSTGKYIIAANDNRWSDEKNKSKTRRTFLLNKEGLLIKDYEGFWAKFYKGVVFSKSERYAVMIGRRERADFIETETGNILFRYSLWGKSDRWVYRADIAEQGETVIFLTADPITKKNPEILVMNFAGETIWSKDFPELDYLLADKTISSEPILMELSISEDGQILAFVIGNKILHYQVKK